MKLHWSPRSPFVRKVMIVLHETGLTPRVECVRTVVAMAGHPPEVLLPDNPLGKIPTLVLEDGTALFDSRVIAEYLDGLHDGPRLFPSDPAARMQQLRWMAFADGLTDVLLLWRNERLRPRETWHRVLLEAFEIKARSSLAQIAAEVPALARAPFGIGHVSMVCMLGQLDFRFGDSNWRVAFPELAAWYEDMRARPSVSITEIRDDSPLSGDPEEPAFVLA
jgi:glutathione S-transferase